MGKGKTYVLLALHDVENTSSAGKPVRWAYAIRTALLEKYAPRDFYVLRASDADTHKWGWDRLTANIDCVYICDYALATDYCRKIRAAGFRGPICVSFNKDSRSRHREWQALIESRDEDTWVIVNNLDRWSMGTVSEGGGSWSGVLPGTCCISNGIDSEVFNLGGEQGDRSRLAIWTGGTGPAKKKGFQDILVPLRDRLHPWLPCQWRVVTEISERQVWPAEDMAVWYNAATHVICASETEGTPGFLLEAMACGCVPIATPVGNVPELGLPPELVVPLENRTVNAFAKAIEWSLEREPELRRWAAEKIERDWSWVGRFPRADYYFGLFRRLIRKGTTLEPFSFWDIKPGDLW